jgi:uncharacterized peroxidase-related enzyme
MWIRTVDETKAEGLVKSFYDGVRKQRGSVANIVKVFSLHPDSMRASMGIYHALMLGPAPLDRAHREMIALVVSSINHCHY